MTDMTTTPEELLSQARDAQTEARAARDALPFGPARSAVNAAIDRLDVALSAIDAHLKQHSAPSASGDLPYGGFSWSAGRALAMLNDLTEAETNATASVAGLTEQPAPAPRANAELLQQKFNEGRQFEHERMAAIMAARPTTQAAPAPQGPKAVDLDPMPFGHQDINDDDGTRPQAAPAPQADDDCPACKGATVRGMRRGVVCLSCNGTGAAQAAPAPQPSAPSGEPAAIPREVIRDMLDDTREVFAADSNVTPQIVRDVIEYVGSWLSVYADKRGTAPLMANGLTEAETSATASVAGLAVQTDPQSVRKALMSLARRDVITDADRIVIGAAIGHIGAAHQAATASLVGLSDTRIDEIADAYEDQAGRIRVDAVFPFARAIEAELKQAAPQAAPVPAPSDMEDPVMVPRGLIGAACSAITHKRGGPKLLEQLRRYTFGDCATTAAAAAPEQALTDAARDVLAERQRQIEVEGWTPEHDDAHSFGELARAGAAYAAQSLCAEDAELECNSPSWWPWDRLWWKPSGRRRMLVKAGALILAEIERLDRAHGITATTAKG